MNKQNVFLLSISFAATLLLASIGSAQEGCQQEAQIIAKVSATQKSGLSSCLVQISEIQQFNPSYVCPLFVGELSQGIEVGMKSGHDCAFDVGDPISGVLVKNQSGVIVLE